LKESVSLDLGFHMTIAAFSYRPTPLRLARTHETEQHYDVLRLPITGTSHEFEQRRYRRRVIGAFWNLSECQASRNVIPAYRKRGSEALADRGAALSPPVERVWAWVMWLPGGTEWVSQTLPPILDPRPIVTRPSTVAPA
jgi:hypothetical protein